MRKEVVEIIKDREIKRLDSIECLGIHYEQWEIIGNVWSDQVETLLENGYQVAFLDGKVNISRELPISPEQKMENKRFWRELGETIDEVAKK